jgi:hypothetical protein
MRLTSRKYFVFVIILFSFFYESFCQSNTGFLKGDKELVRFIEKEFSIQEYKDTLTYHFTIALLKFDNRGNLDSIKFMTEGDLNFKKCLELILLKTKTMWDTTFVKNRMLLIPFEIINYDTYDSGKIFSKDRMISYDFSSLFRQEYSLITTIIRPIIIAQFDPIRRYKN